MVPKFLDLSYLLCPVALAQSLVKKEGYAGFFVLRIM